MKKVWITLIIIMIMTAGVTMMCGCDFDGKDKDDVTEDYITYNNDIEYVKWLNMVTGANGVTDTTLYGVGGTDLGFPIYNSVNGNMYVAFGDTFLKPDQTGMWRSNVLAVTQDFDLSDGLEIEDFITNSANYAKTVIEGKHVDNYEMTKIPTGGVEINGTMYMFYFSKRTWNVSGGMNYGGAVKSTDNGNTWERVYDLTWIDNSVEQYRDNIATLVNENASLTAIEGNIDIDSHRGHGFTQICPIDGKDGYIYILGEGDYRTGGIRLGRVAYDSIEIFEEYEYFNGYGQGNPIWVKGSDGLKTVMENSRSYIISDRCSEQCVMYNEYLGKWVVVYLVNNGAGIVCRMADELWGEYSEPKVLVSYSYPFTNGSQAIYSGTVHEKWTKDNGKTMYMIISQWMPVYNSSVVEIRFK